MDFFSNQTIILSKLYTLQPKFIHGKCALCQVSTRIKTISWNLRFILKCRETAYYHYKCNKDI